MWGEHHAHNQKILVSVGQSVKRGDVIAISDSKGNVTGPHDHFEVWKIDPQTKGWTYFPYNLTKEQTQAIYADPAPYISGDIPVPYTHLGYDFLTHAKYDKGWVYHPGKDLALPSGNKVKAVHDGVVAFVQLNNSGWGDHIFIKWVEGANMSVRTELDKSGLAKAKQGFFVNNSDNGEDIQDYFNTLYGGKPLGDWNMMAFLDYMWKHPARKKAMDAIAKLKTDNAALQQQVKDLQAQVGGGSVDKVGINSLADQIKKKVGY